MFVSNNYCLLDTRHKINKNRYQYYNSNIIKTLTLDLRFNEYKYANLYPSWNLSSVFMLTRSEQVKLKYLNIICMVIIYFSFNKVIKNKAEKIYRLPCIYIYTYKPTYVFWCEVENITETRAMINCLLFTGLYKIFKCVSSVLYIII